MTVNLSLQPVFSAVRPAADAVTGGKVDLDIGGWHWPVLIGVLAALLLIDILVIHRKA
ncbi:MAG: hypothetical protein RJA51_270, partial [Actinomycetota bacterium]